MDCGAFIIIRTCDNGPTAWRHYYDKGIEPPGSTAGDRGRKWILYEGGIRQPVITRWTGKIPEGRFDKTSLARGGEIVTIQARLNGLK